MKTFILLSIDFVVNFLLWFAIIYFVTRVVTKKNNPNPNIKKILVIAAVISLIATYPSYILTDNTFQKSSGNTQTTSGNTQTTPGNTQTTSGNTQTTPGNTQTTSSISANMTEKDGNRLTEIIINVYQKQGYLTPEIHKEFWSILDKYGEASNDIVDKLRYLYANLFNGYMECFYLDALKALETGKSFKSSRRGQYERELQGTVLTESRIKTNDEMIEKIAKKEPAQSNGTSLVFTEEIINQSLENLDIMVEQLELLFSKP